MMLLRFKPSPLPSPLPGVADDAWTKLVRTLDVQDSRAVSASGGFGSYDLRPRRLVELGYATNLRAVRSEDRTAAGASLEFVAVGRQIYECDFVLPLTRGRLLADPRAQLAILYRSMRLHNAQISNGEILRPEAVSLAGALTILLLGGRGALSHWPDLFSYTRELYEAAQGAF